ncbi:MAG: hypothetical protein JXA91_08610 [Candidatus Thermoplasmatota archaeon]|nr:hypothetical protein [Candidatus Thermoplasmatota archaeon]
MGFHKAGLVSIGAYVSLELRDYIDRLTIERGFLTRSDAIRAIICEHRAIFSDEIDRNKALTPLKVNVNDNLQRFFKNKIKEVK